MKRKARSEEYNKRKNLKKEEKRKLTPDVRKVRNKRKNLNHSQNQVFKIKKNRRQTVKRNQNTELMSQKNKESYRRVQERNTGFDNLVKTYESNIREGPTFACNCCGDLFFRKGVSIFDLKELENRVGIELINTINQIKTISSDIILCVTCKNDMNKHKIPKLCLGNGLNYPEIPNELKVLTPLEERLISPRLPFMQIRELGIDKQYGVKGNIVNVPINVDQCVNILPRKFDDTQIIQLKLKRMIRHKSDYLNDYIRPSIVFTAAQYLVEQQLYKEENITLDFLYKVNHTEDQHKFILNEEDKNDKKESNTVVIEDEDFWDETKDVLDVNPANNETLLRENIVFAPGEGVMPLSIVNDTNAEELAFPSIYCGQKREYSVKLTYHDIVKSELRRYDRRSCTVPKIFYMYRKQEMINLKNAINIHLRRSVNYKDVTAGELLNNEFIERLIKNDDAYRVLQGDRSSPSFWNSKMKEVMSMIRQIGIPTLFMTLSAAETHWVELLVILVKVLENKDISESEAKDLSYIQKCNLIRRDPVTCSRYFDHRFKELIKLLKSENGPFGINYISDYYFRIEFQHRGSPHVHCLLWLKDAPIYDKTNHSSNKECEEFINKFISIDKEYLDPAELINYQFHKHSKSCKKNMGEEIICRFGIPYYPMKTTLILEPFSEEEFDYDQIDYYEGLLELIEDAIKDIDSSIKKFDNTSIDLDFEQFLERLGISNDNYINAIRSGLKRAQVFLIRSPGDIRINAFNSDILKLWRANMDIQFILDPYACVHYIVNYINKSLRGMSQLLRQVVEETKSGYISHRQRLNSICSKFLNCSEVSSQEAVYILLSMPLSICSRSTIFINTGDREQRIKIVKSENDLKNLNPECTDIMELGLLDHYVCRPAQLEEICLADFAANYQYSKRKSNKITLGDDFPNLDSVIDDNEDTKSELYKLMNNSGWVHLRSKSKVIRYRRYQFEKDPNNYYREMLMLYVPWRNEGTELYDINYEEKFNIFRDVIVQKSKNFVKDYSINYDVIRTNVEKEFDSTPDLRQDTAEEFRIHDLQRPNYEIETEIQNTNNPKQGSFLSQKLYNNDEYLQILRILNVEQRKFLLETMHTIKTSDSPLYFFVTGRAGCGKSVLIKALYQSLVRWYNFKHGEPEKIKVLLCGPTGKSAFNIGGTTIHAALGITVSQNSTIINMSADFKNTMRTKLWHLKLIIIDEVSMVGASTLMKIDHQLRQIFDSNLNFGGISILFFGDFYQLRPVMDRYIFEDSSRNAYSCLSGVHLWKSVKLFELTQIMRQREDKTFALALTNLANGTLNDTDIELFSSRLYERDSDELPINAIRLFATNEKVDNYNNYVISSSEEKGYFSEAIDFASSSMSKSVRDRALFIVSQLKTMDTYGLCRTLTLKRGIRYMITNNIDVFDGLVNGTTGILRVIECKTLNDVDVPETLWFEFEEESIGFGARSKSKPYLFGDKYLTPIQRVIRDIQTKTHSRIVSVSRKQFPLIPSEATTIHKAQGQTFEVVVVDQTRKMDRFKLYTALSRAKTARGLYLVGEEFRVPPNITSEHPLNKEMNRLREKSMLTVKLKFLSELNLQRDDCVIFFQNMPYLGKHVEDLRCDQNIMMSTILIMVEVRANHIDIPGFVLLDQIKYNERRPFGITFYGKENIKFDFDFEKIIKYDKDSHLEILIAKGRYQTIISIYCSPHYPKHTLINQLKDVVKCLSSTHVLIVGDFNIEINQSLGVKLEQILSSYGLKFVLPRAESSTNYETQIDLAFSSKTLDGSYYYESLVSDHKPIFLVTKHSYNSVVDAHFSSDNIY